MLIRPKAGILDPQGIAVQQALPALGFDGVQEVHVGRMVELEVPDPARLPEMCEKLLANPLVEDYEIRGRSASTRAEAPPRGRDEIRRPAIPRSCDEVDAQLAAGRVGEAEILWHGERDLKGVDAVIVPGGFSYGDYLRAGAIARFAPMMESVIDFARQGGLVLGICNGFQVLCEARLLPVRCCRTSTGDSPSGRCSWRS